MTVTSFLLDQEQSAMQKAASHHRWRNAPEHSYEIGHMWFSLDSSIHSSYLTQVKRAKEHGLPQIRLTGIGGKSDILNMVGIVQLRTPEGRVKRIQCYVFDSPLGPTQKILLLSLQSVIEASINIIHCQRLKFY